MKKVLFVLLCLSLSSYADEAALSLCKIGFLQSPINIEFPEPTDMPDLKFKYHEAKMHFINDPASTVYAIPDEALFLEVDGVPYLLKNIHVHAPSEHRADGKQFPLEIHFAHQSFEGDEYTVAQWVHVGRNNPALDTLIKNFSLGKKMKPNTQLQFGLDPSGLIAPFHNFYSYKGSQTFPPCTENVTWFVMKNTIEVGSDQIAALKLLLGNNSRALQRLNARIIYSNSSANN